MAEYGIERLRGKPYFNNEGWWVSGLNYVDEVNDVFKGKRVAIHDVTLRDGEQTIGVAYSPDERIRIVEALDELGVHRIEVGMPPASREIVDGIKRVAQYNFKNSEPVTFIRTMKSDIDLSIECGVKTVILEHITNPYACEAGYGLDKAKVVDRIVSSVHYAKEQGLKTIFMGWDLTRGDDLDFIKDLYTNVVKESSPHAVVVVDTLGVAMPRAVGFLFRKLSEWIPGVPLEFHTHDEFGLANAGILEAIAQGVSVVHTACNGLGERTGNAATEEVAVMLELLAGIKTGLNLDRIMGVSLLVEHISRRPVPANKPIVGRGLFNMETGITTDLQLKMKKAGFNNGILPFMPALVGQDPVKFVLGKNSGAASIEYFLDKFGFKATEDQVKEITDRVKVEGRIQRAVLTEGQFLNIARNVLG